MDNTVETMLEGQAQDDAVQTAHGETRTLSEVMGEEPAADAAAPDGQGPAREEEPRAAGWIKTRIEKGVEKRVAQAEARIRAEYEARYAPLHEAYLNQEADRLVDSGKITDRDMALDYLRRGGGSGETNAQPRDAQGRFAAADVQRRGNELFAQAGTIKALTGVDVMAMYNDDPDVKQRILSGEWDFVDAYNAGRERAPAPVRSANGARLGNAGIAGMTSAQFAKLEETLARGGRIDMRR